MPQKAVKAIVATVKYAGFEFQGLKLPSGEYRIAISQVVELFQRSNKGFQFLKKNAQRDIKTLLGNGFQFLKIASEINPKKVNTLTLEEFGELTFHVAFKGNEIAKAILKASVTTTIEQAFDIAFNEKQKLEEYNKRLAARVQGKLTRRTLTDAIKDYLEKNSTSSNYKKFIYSNCSDEVNRIVFGRTAKKLKENWNCIDVRSAFTTEELLIVESLERLAIALIDRKNFEPFLAVKEAGERMLIEVIAR